MDEKQDYFNIGKLSESIKADLAKLDGVKRDDPEIAKKLDDFDFQVWTVMVLLAIAQQLSVISGTLARCEVSFKELAQAILRAPTENAQEPAQVAPGSENWLEREW